MCFAVLSLLEAEAMIGKEGFYAVEWNATSECTEVYQAVMEIMIDCIKS